MKLEKTFKNLISVLLIGGFLLAYFLDFTGLTLHQWLGIAIAGVVTIHLIMHWEWVKVVSVRLFNKTSSKARLYFVLDTLLFFGLGVITLTGLIISTWFNLAISTYPFWLKIHIASSIVSLTLLIIKLAVHWKFISNIFRLPRAVKRVTEQTVSKPVSTADPKLVSRREALHVIGVVSFAGIIGLSKAVSALSDSASTELPQPFLTTQTIPTNQAEISEPATEQATPESIPTTQPTAQAAQTIDLQPANTVSQDCVIRCSRGCAYPGRCRRYTDDNNNGLCDLGECLIV